MQAYRGFFRNLELDIMTGSVKDEGAMFVPEALTQTSEMNADELMKKDTSEEERKNIMKSIIAVNPSGALSKTLVNFLSYLAKPVFDAKQKSQASLAGSVASTIAALMFDCPTHLYSSFVASSAKQSNVYSYRVIQKPRWPFLGAGACLEWMGVCHADELVYVFSQPFRLKKYFPNDDYEFTKQVMNIWTEFANYG